MSRKDNVELTRADRRHLIGLLVYRKEDGGYSGKQEDYYSRTEKLIMKLTENMQ